MAMEQATRLLDVDQKEQQVKWVAHYSSKHQILLVGEGDFSFSLSLASSFASASNICASSLDSRDDVIKKYKNGRSNLEILKKLGASVLHGVDACKMKDLPGLKMRKFDRIIFNFPHAGFRGKESNYFVIENHKSLVSGFFSNASRMLQVDGQIHVNHKITPPFGDWNLENLASAYSLVLKEDVEFKKEDYPGYENKRGDGWRCDEPFPLKLGRTFKFRLGSMDQKRQQVQYSSVQMQLLTNTSGFNYLHGNPSVFNTCLNAAVGRDFNHPRQAELQRTLSYFCCSQRNHIQCHRGSPSIINTGRDINYPSQAEQWHTLSDIHYLQRYHSTEVNHIQPNGGLTSAIHYLSQAALRHTIPDFSCPQIDQITDMNHIRVQPHPQLPSIIEAGDDHLRVFGDCLNGPIQTYRRPYSIPERVRYNSNIDFQRQMVEVPRKRSSGNLYSC